MLTCHETALWLLSFGCSVIPIAPRSKKPLASVLPGGKWEEFQTRHATVEEVYHWFTTEPNANIALVCGAISGVVAVDVDGAKGQEWFKREMPKPNWWQFTSEKTKFHAFYKHPGNGIRIPPAVRIAEEIDVRGDGSYVVFAPSVHPTGAVYQSRTMDGFTGPASLVPMPDIKLTRGGNGKTEWDGKVDAANVGISLEVHEGERNQALTKHCGRMYALGCSVDEVLVFAHGWNATYCNPPLSAKEIETTVRSMANTHGRHNPQAINAGGVARWVALSSGDFTIADIYRDLGISRAEDKESCQAGIRDLLTRGEIERCGKRSGWYRKREAKIDAIDLDAKDLPSIDLWLPFGLHRDVVVQPKNIVVVAGETNSGKTGLLFNFCYMNRNKHKIRYLASEMTPNEIRDRIASFGLDRAEWANIEFFERGENFHDAIDPDGINIIDFLEVHDAFYAIGGDIKRIFDALRSGIAIIAIQKRTGEMYGRGGEFTLEKARLGLSLFTHGRLPNGIVGSVKVTKAKNYVQGRNPEGKEQFYQLSRGYYYDNTPLPHVGYKRGFRFYPRKERERVVAEIERHCKHMTEQHVADEVVNFYGEAAQ